METPRLFVSVAGFCIAQTAVPGLLLITTPKGSRLRHLWIPCSLWLTYQFFLLSGGASSISIQYANAAMQVFVASLQAANLLILSPVDEGHLLRVGLYPSQSSGLSRIWRASRLFIASRGIGTPWVVKNIPQHPEALAARAGPRIPKSAFLLRQAVVFAWQYVLLDVLYVVATWDESSAAASTTRFDYREVRAVEWPRYVFMALFSWFVVARVLIDASYRAAALVAVGLGGSSPEDWPPLFGSMWMAFTLRNFWGKFWHQFLRWPFTSTANYLARDLLRLPRPSPVERYLNTFFVFLLSGLLHVMVDSVQGVLPSESGAMTFFPLFTLGFMIEDGIQEAWKRLHASRQNHQPNLHVNLWQRMLGFVWVITWMSVTSPPYLLASRQSSEDNRQLVPFSVVQVTGVYAGVIWILVGGVMVKVIFGGEP
ncbi:Acetyltransferase pyr8 [Metarhizium anisopliae]|nr:Acetyltransferase pyr8 [Metarhizium anisopliae]